MTGEGSEDSRRGWEDFAAAAFFFAVGLAALVAAVDYPIGSLRRTGPGLFPLLISAGLMLVGAGLALQVLLARKLRSRPQLRLNPGVLRPVVMVMAGLGAFALLVRPAGLFASVVALVLVVSFAEPAKGLLARLVLAVSLATLCSLIFVVGIGIPIRIWP